MTTQAGVKTIVVGGRPTTGPMQTAGGNRGARLYSSEAIDFDIENINSTLDEPEVAATLPDREDTGMWINFAGLNLEDQIREGDEARIPLQFRYEAAQCRIYFTLDNVYNVSRLWRDAAAATWDDPSLCVEDSTGYAPSHDLTVTPKPPPPRTAQSPNVTFSLGEVETPENDFNTTLGIINRQERKSISSKGVTVCNTGGKCGGTAQCKNVPVTCPNGKNVPLAACLPSCTSVGSACAEGMECVLTAPAETKKNQLPARRGQAGQAAPARYEQVTIWNGYCKPKSVDPHKFPSLPCGR